MEDPGRLPYRQLMRETERQTREAEARAAIRARNRGDDETRLTSGRGLRGALSRLRDALRRRS
jgi:hypothetical protein